MKRFLFLCAAAALAVMVPLAVADDLKSGLQPGDSIGAFDVVKCSGASEDGVKVGAQLCYRCKYGGRPMVMVFARTADESLAALTTKLDEEVAEHSDKKLAAFVNLMGADREALEDQAEKFGKDTKVSNVPIVVPVEFENGPADYGINPDVGVTVIVADKGAVVASHALAADGLTEEAVAAIIADVEKLVN
jgi:hypothetical protein